MGCTWNSSCHLYHPQSANGARKPRGREGGEEREKPTTRHNRERISVWANHGLDVEDFGGGVVGPAPGRAEEHHVRAQAGRQRHEVPAQEVDALGHAVHLRVVARQPQLLGIDVDGNHCPREMANTGINGNRECHPTTGRSPQSDTDCCDNPATRLKDWTRHCLPKRGSPSCLRFGRSLTTSMKSISNLLFAFVKEKHLSVAGHIVLKIEFKKPQPAQPKRWMIQE